MTRGFEVNAPLPGEVSKSRRFNQLCFMEVITSTFMAQAASSDVFYDHMGQRDGVCYLPLKIP